MRRLSAWLGGWMLLACAVTARAQLIDRVDVERTDGLSEIRIRFVANVQYVRHFPRSEGRVLSIEVRFARPAEPDGRTLSESRRSAPTPELPGFNVVYPQEDGTLGLRFDRPVRYEVRAGPDARSIYVYVPATPAAADVEAQAAALLRESHIALGAGDAGAAVEKLNALLNLPPNRQSESAQELIGIARERNDQPAKARAEYELYLRLYPQAQGAARVRERLAALPAERPLPAGVSALRRPEKTEVTHSGGFSQFYYRGASKYDATLAPPAPGLQLDRVSLTAVDQSSLVTSLDVATRIRAPAYDGKFVLRDIHTANYLRGQDDPNRLYAAYYDHQNAGGDWFARAGRQPGSSSGLPTRFDGVAAGVRFVPALRLNVAAGEPVEFFPFPQKRVYGTSLDVLPGGGAWSANLFFVEQKVATLTDRRAVGSELRYFDQRTSLFALVDYDTEFRALNTYLVQANLTAGRGTNYTVLLDHRRVPQLQLTNALPGEPLSSIGELLTSGVSEEALRADARALTPLSDLWLVGFTHPVTQRLQLGADVRVSEVSGTGATALLPATPPSGKVTVYSGQAIRSGVLSASDTGVAALSVIRGEPYSGYSVALSHVYVNSRWRTETAVRYYRQRNNLGVDLERLAPSLRVGYRWRDQLSFELELGEELSTNQGPLQSDRLVRRYFSLGYRWDFR